MLHSFWIVVITHHYHISLISLNLFGWIFIIIIALSSMTIMMSSESNIWQYWNIVGCLYLFWMKHIYKFKWMTICEHHIWMNPSSLAIHIWMLFFQFQLLLKKMITHTHTLIHNRNGLVSIMLLTRIREFFFCLFESNESYPIITNWSIEGITTITMTGTTS